MPQYWLYGVYGTFNRLLHFVLLLYGRELSEHSSKIILLISTKNNSLWIWKGWVNNAVYYIFRSTIPLMNDPKKLKLTVPTRVRIPWVKSTRELTELIQLTVDRALLKEQRKRESRKLQRKRWLDSFHESHQPKTKQSSSSKLCFRWLLQ